jgi:arginine N-succinyltransferase
MEDAFLVRGATPVDVAGLYELSRYLDSVNLPHDRRELARILERSEGSFSGAITEPRDRQYLFVVEERSTGRLIGTSMILAQLGTKDAPYTFFDVRREERYSETLDRHFVHHVLSIGYSYHGPTEIGGLVVRPEYRLRPERLGMRISFIRFLFMAARRGWFQNRVLAELMPPLEPDGTSRLWQAVGAHFTGLTYREADRLSKRNKEFIRGLFPRGDIYASLLPVGAQEVIGAVGSQTRGVAKLLERIGFRYWDRIDPFDGGPHYMAMTDEIVLVQESRRVDIALGDAAEGDRVLLLEGLDGPPYVRATVARGRVSREAERPRACLRVPAGSPLLGEDPEAERWALPLRG